MSFAWQTVEQAAVTLGISTRTIARRIAKGELESRLNAGRREVYIAVPAGAAKPQAADTIDADFTESDVQPEPSYEETIRHTVSTASTGFGADVETSTALILAEDRARRAEMAITVIQQSTAIVRDEVYRARSGARWAWVTVAAMAACVMVSIGWATQTMTRSHLQAQALREKATLATDAVERQERDFKANREKLEADLVVARQSAARAQGQLEEVRGETEKVRSEVETVKAELAAAKEKPATTKPANVAARIANAVFGD